MTLSVKKVYTLLGHRRAVLRQILCRRFQSEETVSVAVLE